MSFYSFLKCAIPSWWALVSSPRPRGRIAVLSTVWPHHAQRSGYHPVSNGLGVMLRRDRVRLTPARISRLIAGDGLDEALQIALAMKLMHRDCLLIIDGDFQLHLIKDLRKVTTARIYAVFHQIPKLLEQLLAQATPQLLDGAVCVARCQIPLLQSVVLPEKILFVPHGVDTGYFTPRAPRSDQPSVLCVGCHCRDFETLRKSAELITQAVPNATVRLIAPRIHLPAGLNLGRVELVTDLSDQQLLDEYRSAWVVLLPLTASTANNSLLESMACGTPIVVTDVGGVRDYAGPECGALCPLGDAEAHAAAVIALLLDPRRREAAARAARDRADNYAWPVVQEQIRQILDNSHRTRAS
jgi:glycosyltransferase involved in cell wall biosynthesis